MKPKLPVRRATPPVCIVDDDPAVRESLGGLLASAGIPVETYASAADFLARPNRETPSCLVLDLVLPGLSGLDLQRELVRMEVAIPTIFLSGHGDISTSVSAIKAGAMEFLTKPFDPDDVLDAIQDAMLTRESRESMMRSVNMTGKEIVGGGGAHRILLKRIAMVAPTDATVLIQGETGTGKELIAHEIHQISRRRDQTLVKVNCASIPHELYESEFFGHVRGAFTGAVKDRIGRFEAAHGGTLFLDEIGEIPLDLQCKLLRALQEKQYERVGDDRTRRADVRVIAATNRDLRAEVEAGRFRRDLYYRLSVFPIEALPLRKRLEDIPLLARHFVEVLTRELRCVRPRLTEAGIAKLQDYDWPGNIRELRNVIERAIIVAQGKGLEFDLPLRTAANLEVARPIVREGSAKPAFLTEPEMLQRIRDNLCTVLRETDWKIKGANGAAELLGVKPTTLIARIKKLGLKRENFSTPVAT